MSAFLTWPQPRWGQMLCFWGAGVLIAGCLFETMLIPLSARIGFEVLFEGTTGFRVAVVLIMTGLALKALAIWRDKP